MKLAENYRGEAIAKTIWAIFLIIVTFGFIVLIYPYIKSVLILLVIAWIISVILNPAVDYFESVGLNRSIAIFLVMLLIILILAGCVALILPAVMRAIDNISNRIQSDFIKEITDELAKVFEQKLHNAGLVQDLVDKLTLLGSNLLSNLSQILKSATSFVAFIGIIPFVTFFLIRDRRVIYRKLISQVPNKYFEMTLNVLHKVGKQVTSYIQGQAIDALIVGLLSAVALGVINLIFGNPVPYFFFIGMIAGIANLIPYLGPIVGLVPAITLTILNAPPSVGNVILWIIISFVMVQVIDNNIVSPLVVSKSVNMHPITVVIAVIIGGNLGGVIGMLIAVPLWGIIKVTINEIIWGLKNYKLK